MQIEGTVLNGVVVLDAEASWPDGTRVTVAPNTPVARLSEAQRAELRRRAAEDDANPEETISWEDVKAEARRRKGR